jgi:hypothetical protein
MPTKIQVTEMIGVRASQYQREALDRIAARRGVRISRIIREALDAAIDADMIVQLTERRSAA